MHGTMNSVVENDTLTCPITLELFRDPVIAADGHTYERTAITQWILDNGTSPLTRQPLSVEDLQPNDELRRLAANARRASRRVRALPPLKQERENNAVFVHSTETIITRSSPNTSPSNFQRITISYPPASSSNNRRLVCSSGWFIIICNVCLMIIPFLPIIILTTCCKSGLSKSTSKYATFNIPSKQKLKGDDQRD